MLDTIQLFLWSLRNSEWLKLCFSIWWRENYISFTDKVKYEWLNNMQMLAQRGRPRLWNQLCFKADFKTV